MLIYDFYAEETAPKTTNQTLEAENARHVITELAKLFNTEVPRIEWGPCAQCLPPKYAACYIYWGDKICLNPGYATPTVAAHEYGHFFGVHQTRKYQHSETEGFAEAFEAFWESNYFQCKVCTYPSLRVGPRTVTCPKCTATYERE